MVQDQTLGAEQSYVFLIQDNFSSNFNTHSCLDWPVSDSNKHSLSTYRCFHIHFLILSIIFWYSYYPHVQSHEQKKSSSERFSYLPKVTSRREGAEISTQQPTFKKQQWLWYCQVPELQLGYVWTQNIYSRNSRHALWWQPHRTCSESPLQYEIIIHLPVTFFCRFHILKSEHYPLNILHLYHLFMTYQISFKDCKEVKSAR